LDVTLKVAILLLITCIFQPAQFMIHALEPPFYLENCTFCFSCQPWL